MKKKSARTRDKQDKKSAMGSLFISMTSIRGNICASFPVNEAPLARVCKNLAKYRHVCENLGVFISSVMIPNCEGFATAGLHSRKKKNEEIALREVESSEETRCCKHIDMYEKISLTELQRKVSRFG